MTPSLDKKSYKKWAGNSFLSVNYLKFWKLTCSHLSEGEFDIIFLFTEFSKPTFVFLAQDNRTEKHIL